MSSVLLVDPNPHHAAAVLGALRGLRCKTIVLPDLRSASHLMRMHSVECVVMACASDTDWHREIEAILTVARALPDPPDIICLLQGPYQGPRDRVYATRKGFVVIHE